MIRRVWILIWVLGCGPSASSDSAEDSDTDTDTSLSDDPCVAPLVTLQTGQDDTCSGGNQHSWPVNMGDDYCHGWGAVDTSGNSHQNSASQIQCNEDGSFSFTQYAGNLECSGTGVTKTFYLDVCEQDIPPVLYTKGLDLACCLTPDGPDCKTGTPQVSVPGGEVFLNGSSCND